MDLLYKILIDPFVQMGAAPDLLVQTLWEGLVAGVLYSLIALGFVLIFKASGVFNFAQGIMVVFAAMSLVALHGLGIPAFLALALTFAVMRALAWTVERLVLRPLVNQPDIILFMATFGITYFLIGFGEFVFGGEPKVMIADALCLPQSSPRSWWRRLPSSSKKRGSDVHCGRLRTATRRLSRSASRSSRYGSP